MKISEFKRQLAGMGARFEEGTKHTKVYLNGRQTTLPAMRLRILATAFVAQSCVKWV